MRNVFERFILDIRSVEQRELSDDVRAAMEYCAMPAVPLGEKLRYVLQTVIEDSLTLAEYTTLLRTVDAFTKYDINGTRHRFEHDLERFGNDAGGEAARQKVDVGAAVEHLEGLFELAGERQY